MKSWHHDDFCPRLTSPPSVCRHSNQQLEKLLPASGAASEACSASTPGAETPGGPDPDQMDSEPSESCRTAAIQDQGLRPCSTRGKVWRSGWKRGEQSFSFPCFSFSLAPHYRSDVDGLMRPSRIGCEMAALLDSCRSAGCLSVFELSSQLHPPELNARLSEASSCGVKRTACRDDGLWSRRVMTVATIIIQPGAKCLIDRRIDEPDKCHISLLC